MCRVDLISFPGWLDFDPGQRGGILFRVDSAFLSNRVHLATRLGHLLDLFLAATQVRKRAGKLLALGWVIKQFIGAVSRLGGLHERSHLLIDDLEQFGCFRRGHYSASTGVRLNPCGVDIESGDLDDAELFGQTNHVDVGMEPVLKTPAASDTPKEGPDPDCRKDSQVNRRSPAFLVPICLIENRSIEMIEQVIDQPDVAGWANQVIERRGDEIDLVAG